MVDFDQDGLPDLSTILDKEIRPCVHRSSAVQCLGSPDKGVHLQGGQDNFYVAWVFALELKLSKTLSGLVYSVLQF